MLLPMILVQPGVEAALVVCGESQSVDGRVCVRARDVGPVSVVREPLLRAAVLVHLQRAHEAAVLY